MCAVLDTIKGRNIYTGGHLRSLLTARICLKTPIIWNFRDSSFQFIYMFIHSFNKDLKMPLQCYSTILILST